MIVLPVTVVAAKVGVNVPQMPIVPVLFSTRGPPTKLRLPKFKGGTVWEVAFAILKVELQAILADAVLA